VAQISGSFAELRPLGGGWQALCQLRFAMTALRYLSTFYCVFLLGGCCPCGFLIKQESELNCPTDIRQTVPWCAGEDAIFRGPCGPNREFYGYKPTCWDLWPASGAQWRNTYCGPLPQDHLYGEPSGGEPGDFEVGELRIPTPEVNSSAEEAIGEGPLIEEPLKDQVLEIESNDSVGEEADDLSGPLIPPSLPTTRITDAESSSHSSSLLVRQTPTSKNLPFYPLFQRQMPN
jgi:hypothetical protein